MGDVVTWTYIVANRGNVNLSDMAVVDDAGGGGEPVLVCSTPTLGPGLSHTCTLTGTAVEGPYTNTGTVTAWYAGHEVTGWDASHYLGERYRIYLPLIMR
jgi:hypothetical protein